jgi:hypothetical protein
VIRCGRCGRGNDASFAFCLGCGQPLAGGAPALTPMMPGAPRPGLPPLAAPPRRGVVVRLAVVRSDGGASAEFALSGDAICGRTEGAIRLTGDPTVSPRHARFEVAPGRVAVEDLGSLNGTFVRIASPRRLAPGDTLRVGRQVLRLDAAGRPADPGGVRPWGSPDRGHRLRLVQLLDGGGTGEAFPLGDGEHVVGRQSGDIAFPADRYVSGRHARLDVQGGTATLTDLGSSNGTFVRIAGPTELAPGDQLLVGAQLLRLEA